MAWISMRQSVPCVLRHSGDAANYTHVRPMVPVARWPRHARRWLAVLPLVGAVTAFSRARNDKFAATTLQELIWRNTCLTFELHASFFLN
jgi:hypothetical protein